MAWGFNNNTHHHHAVLSISFYNKSACVLKSEKILNTLFWFQEIQYAVCGTPFVILPFIDCACGQPNEFLFKCWGRNKSGEINLPKWTFELTGDTSVRKGCACAVSYPIKLYFHGVKWSVQLGYPTTTPGDLFVSCRVLNPYDYSHHNKCLMYRFLLFNACADQERGWKSKTVFLCFSCCG